jgi:phosphoheptose isomerase/hydrogenase maturation factor
MTTTAIDGGLGVDLAADLAAAALTLAKRFAAGATMWSIAPSWEPHALHIAVEFVHPVIVGKRALPAVALTGADLVDLVRVSVRPGDIVIAVAGADNLVVRSVMHRSPAWGATTIWIGSGERPEAGRADHVLWLDDPEPGVPAATGGFVLLYHLLWELTHVCFEHPGLLKQTAECADDACVTCSDEGRLGEVLAASAGGTAVVRTAKGVEQVVTTLVDPVAAGELILVHAGTAISRAGDDPGSAASRGGAAHNAPVGDDGMAHQEPTDFLYPFIDAQEDAPASLLADLTASAQAKASESLALRLSTVESNAERLATASAEMARRFAAGGRLFTFGNGGSCTDCTTLARLFAGPPTGQPLPAWSLTADQAILTALGNDVGYELVFARQLIARANAVDIAIAMSTSGNSPNLIAALREARHRDMYTIGFAGYDGGTFAKSSDVDACFVVCSQSVHRIQESQALVGYSLWRAVREHVGGNQVEAG